MKKLIIILAIFSFGCHTNPNEQKAKVEKRELTATETFEVQYIFTFGGAKVYRFYDANEYRYYAVSDSSITVNSEHSEKRGKQTIEYAHSITTVKK